MSEKQIEETEKPLILVIGFFFHKTIAFSEGWLAPRYLILNSFIFFIDVFLVLNSPM